MFATLQHEETKKERKSFDRPEPLREWFGHLDVLGEQLKVEKALKTTRRDDRIGSPREGGPRRPSRLNRSLERFWARDFVDVAQMESGSTEWMHSPVM